VFITALVAEGPAAIPALREALWSRNPRLRRRVPRVLARLDAVEAADDLAELLDDPYLAVEVHALRAIAEFGLARHAAIFERYLDEDVTDLAVHALRGLELADPARAVEVSEQRFLRDPRNEVRMQATAIVDALAPERFGAYVEDACRDRDPRIKCIGFQWLADHAPATALDRSVAALDAGQDVAMHARLIASIASAAQPGKAGSRTPAPEAGALAARSAAVCRSLELALGRELAAGKGEGDEAIGALANALARVLVFDGRLEAYLQDTEPG
jgi:hypothetical protein